MNSTFRIGLPDSTGGNLAPQGAAAQSVCQMCRSFQSRRSDDRQKRTFHAAKVAHERFRLPLH
jgi:hypothetical protein